VLPVGEMGELCTRGYSVMLGYWDNPEATAGSIDQARWMHTGDLAVMDDEGYVNIAGRIKDMVIRGGENIYPREIEEFLYTNPKISDAPFCQGQIAHFKVPRYFKFVDAFPMTVTGKIQKYLMRQQSVEELGLEKIAAVKVA